MVIDFQMLVELNLIVQMILVLLLYVASRLAIRGDFKKHCTLMRIAVPVQILTVLGIMLPSMYGYLRNTSTVSLFGSEILIHHSLGLGVVFLWIYINIIFMGILKPAIKIRTMMRLALISWAVSMLIGLHLYWVVYLS
jgi:uncharacterized membrane protein YozB (DUF420 family)